jgi:hypothetical protein
VSTIRPTQGGLFGVSMPQLWGGHLAASEAFPRTGESVDHSAHPDSSAKERPGQGKGGQTALIVNC